MAAGGTPPRLRAMKLKFWLVVIGLALLILALGGWAVEGVRWTLTGGRSRRPLVRTA